MSRKDTQIIQLETESKGKDRAIARLVMAVAALGLGIVIFAAIKIAGKLR
jgi:hypothetical protein